MNTMKTMIAVLFTVISTVLYATNSVEVRAGAQVKVIAASEAGVYHVIYAGAATNKVGIAIYNERNEQLFSQEVKAEAGFKVPVNLTALPYGVYTVELTDGTDIYRKTVAYRPNTNKVKVAYEQDAAGNVKVNVVGAQGKAVRVLIYDENDHLLIEDTIQGQFNFGRVYNFEQANLSEAEVVVAYQNRVVSDQLVKF